MSFLVSLGLKNFIPPESIGVTKHKLVDVFDPEDEAYVTKKAREEIIREEAMAKREIVLRAMHRVGTEMTTVQVALESGLPVASVSNVLAGMMNDELVWKTGGKKSRKPAVWKLK